MPLLPYWNCIASARRGRPRSSTVAARVRPERRAATPPGRSSTARVGVARAAPRRPWPEVPGLPTAPLVAWHHPRVMASLRDPRTRLVLTSGTLVFVELLLIRWIPAEVRYIGFFSNFLLMASFLGIGLGILLGRRRELESIAIFPVLLVGVVWLITSLQLNVQIRSTNEVFFGL